MNLTSTSKLSGKALGKYALTASFVLHVGVIAGFSSWQWVFELPSKAQKEVIKVKFLPTSIKQKEAQKPIPAKTADFTPAQLISVSSSSIPTLTSRAQVSPTSIFQPEPRVKKSMVFPKKQLKPRSAQQISISNKVTRPRAILLTKNILKNQSPKQTISVRPSPSLSTSPTESIQPATPVDTRGSSRMRFIQPRLASRQARFSKMPTKPSKIALSIKSPAHLLNHIQPRSAPTSSQTTALIETFPASRQAIEVSMSPAEHQTQITTVPRKLIQSLSVDRNTSGVNLNALRGLFTGKVRQRIADAKHYPRTARRRGMEGQPVIAFSLNKEGQLVKVNLAQTSGYQLLDQAALEAVQQAVPYPEIPAELKIDTYKFKLPISFVLK